MADRRRRCGDREYRCGRSATVGCRAW
jgi:hypothetical protein